MSKHRTIRNERSDLLARIANTQQSEWNSQWRDKQTRQSAKQAQEGAKAARHEAQQNAKNAVEERKQHALELTQQAAEELALVSNTLKHTLSVKNVLYWHRLKDNTPFSEPQPISLPDIPQPIRRSFGSEPQLSHPEFQT